LSEVESESGKAEGSVSVVRAPVSFATEELILVDSDDTVIGYRNKFQTHEGAGVLHRAFSAFLFNHRGQLLVHRRSLEKPLWPGFWTNSCCSHPRRGETIGSAVKRRIREELGIDAVATSVYKFEYQARYKNVGSEHELCHVYLARAIGNEAISAHAEEVMEWRWLSLEEVDAWHTDSPEELTPWFRQEWSALRTRYGAQLEQFVQEIKAPDQRGAA